MAAADCLPHCGSVDKKGLIGGLKRGKRKQRESVRRERAEWNNIPPMRNSHKVLESRVEQLQLPTCDTKTELQMQLRAAAVAGYPRRRSVA